MSSDFKVIVDFVIKLAEPEVWGGQYLNNEYERIRTRLKVSHSW